MAYAPRLGTIAQEMTDAGVEVHADLANFSGPPDIIQGNNHLQTIQALLHFPNTPGVFICHDATHWSARPTVFPRIMRHLAVDWNCRERVMRETGLTIAQISVVPNTVNTHRFASRKPLPARPARALVFSNYARPTGYVPTLRSACRRAGLELAFAGSGMGMPAEFPERILGNYDVVFGKARCALEAIAVGCHVVLCDERGLGPTITLENFDELRRWNFGARILTDKITPEAVVERIAAYDPAISAALRDRVRNECALKNSADELLAIHEETIAAFNAGGERTAAAELAALSQYLGALEKDLGRIEDEVGKFLAGRMALPRTLSDFIQKRPALRAFLQNLRNRLKRKD